MAVLLAGALAPSLSGATNGYFTHGYGLKAKGLAGAGVAFPQDSLAGATNPAGIGLVGTRVDIGIDWFQPDRGAAISGSPLPGLNGGYSGNGTPNFWIPELGAAWAVNPQWSVGLAVYGHGGMNTTYNQNPFGALGGSNPGGVDLSQMFVAPTVAWKPVPTQAFGVSVYYAYQIFAAYGLEGFANPVFSTSPARVTNQGDDTSSGWGIRVGWIGTFAACRFGATYQTKTNMSRFKKYEGLFADAGDFDIPSTYGVGAACPIAPGLTLALDYQRINYSDVNAVHNASAPLFAGARLGSANGPGFGWQDMNVFKLGASWVVNPNLTLRGGWSYGKQPIRSADAFINILAPGVVEHHFTAGVTWRQPAMPNLEFTVGAMYAPKKTVTGPIPAILGGGQAEIRLSEWLLGFAAGWRF
jgi:long-chain fatty acid transport protein